MNKNKEVFSCGAGKYIGLLKNLIPLYFAMDGREPMKLGVNFSTEKRTMDAWERG
jgi:hypothetical protein